MRKNLNVTKHRYNELILLASPFALRYIEVPLYTGKAKRRFRRTGS